MSGRAITILGMGMSARHRAQDVRQYCVGEVWGLNNGYLTFEGLTAERGFDRVYELHHYDYLKSWNPGVIRGQQVNHFATLDTVARLVVTGEPLPCIGSQVQLDWEAIFRHHLYRRFRGQSVPAYFRGSPSIMLAHALYEHETGQTVAEIRTWGIDMTDPAHETQLPSWAYWTGQCMAAGIRMTGTSLAWMDRPEMDSGLDGLESSIRERLSSRLRWGPVSPAVVAYATEGSEYVPHLARLAERCKALGMEFYPVTAPAVDRKRDGYNAKPRVIRDALAALSRPVLYIDADDDLTAPVRFPAMGTADVLLVANPERHVIETPLQFAAAAIGFYPTPGAGRFLDAWESACGALNDHRALHVAYYSVAGRDPAAIAFADGSPYLAGAFVQSPSSNPNHQRRQHCQL